MAVPIKKQPIQAVYSGTSFDDVRMDASTHVLSMLEYEHHKIHEGDSFSAHYEQLCTNIGEQTVVAFNTPNTNKWIHIIATGSATAIAKFSIVENTSIDVGEGAQLTIYNKNRNSTKTSMVTSIESPPISNKATYFTLTTAANANITETTHLDTVVIGSAGAIGTGAGAAGALASHAGEWVLEQNQQYAFIIESLSADDNYHTLGLNWYENTNRS